ncbi:MAG: hypothetical protein Q7T74_06755 [Candidatus Saccharibacteria bacterium]|nr:hypothetical protein [Candidatus Saccharibacteria bacterium]
MPTGERLKAYGKQAAWVATSTSAGALAGWFLSLRVQDSTNNALKAKVACVEGTRTTGDISCAADVIGYKLDKNDIDALSKSGYVSQVFNDSDVLAKSVASMFDSVEATEGQPNWFLDSPLYSAALGFALSAAVVVRRVPEKSTIIAADQLQQSFDDHILQGLQVLARKMDLNS